MLVNCLQKLSKSKKRREQLFTLKFRPKSSHKKMRKKAHKNQIFPKKTKKKILQERNENKKKTLQQKPKTFDTSNIQKIQIFKIHPQDISKITKIILMASHPSCTPKK